MTPEAFKILKILFVSFKSTALQHTISYSRQRYLKQDEGKKLYWKLMLSAQMNRSVMYACCKHGEKEIF